MGENGGGRLHLLILDLKSGMNKKQKLMYYLTQVEWIDDSVDLGLLLVHTFMTGPFISLMLYFLFPLMTYESLFIGVSIGFLLGVYFGWKSFKKRYIELKKAVNELLTVMK